MSMVGTDVYQTQCVISMAPGAHLKVVDVTPCSMNRNAVVYLSETVYLMQVYPQNIANDNTSPGNKFQGLI